MVWELFRVNRMDDCNLGFNQGSDPDRNLHYTHSDHGRIWPFRITDSSVKIHFHPTDYTDDGTSRPDCYWCILRLYPTKTQQYDPRAVLAHSVLALPMVLIVISAGLRSYDMNQERVARSLGASRLKAFFVVTLPQIRFSVITGALLAFIVSFDEVIVALFISGGKMSTITRSMFLALRDQIDPTIASISTVMVLITSVALILAQIFGQSKSK